MIPFADAWAWLGAHTTQIGVVAVCTIAAIAPIKYIWRHCRHSPRYHDITLPPADFSWRSSDRLGASVALIGALLALMAFGFTPEALQLAQSDQLPLALFAITVAIAALPPTAKWLKDRSATDPKSIEADADQVLERIGESIADLWKGVAAAVALGALWLPLSGELFADTSQDSNDRYAIEAASDAGDVAGDSDGLTVDIDAMLQRGYGHRDKGDYEAARQTFQQAIAQYPDHPGGHLGLAALAMQRAEFDKAAQSFDRALAAKPGDIASHAGRGLAFAWTGDRDKAASDFAIVRKSDPDNREMLHGEALIAFDRNDYSRALEKLDRALYLEPRDVWALQTRSEVYWAMGDEAAAIRDQQRLEDTIGSLGPIS